MSTSANLSLPYLAAGQAQKHVTVNESLLRLDAIVQLSPVSASAAAEPAEPEDGEVHILPAGKSGAAWSAMADGAIAYWRDGAWEEIAPRPGFCAYVRDEGALKIWTGAAWREGPAVLQGLELLGVGATADAETPFAAKLNKALWSARYEGEGGDGDLRYTLNKEAPEKTLSLLLQSDWSGRAEIGLVGDDDLSMKVSADGAAWKEALVIERSSGRARFPHGLAHAESGAPIVQFIPAPVREIWRADPSRPPRSFTIDAVSGAALTLTAARVGEIFNSAMRDLAAVRVWNVSKSPAQSAWVNWNSSATQMQVTDAAAIASWAHGETLRLGDPNPTGTNVLDMVALDISGYLMSELGAVFPQAGVMVGIRAASTDGAVSLHCSPDGSAGIAFGANAMPNGLPNLITMPLATPIASPLSNSNLVFFRETLVSGGGASDLLICYLRIMGVYV